MLRQINDAACTHSYMQWGRNKAQRHIDIDVSRSTPTFWIRNVQNQSKILENYAHLHFLINYAYWEHLRYHWWVILHSLYTLNFIFVTPINPFRTVIFCYNVHFPLNSTNISVTWLLSSDWLYENYFLTVVRNSRRKKILKPALGLLAPQANWTLECRSWRSWKLPRLYHALLGTPLDMVPLATARATCTLSWPWHFALCFSISLTSNFEYRN